MYIQIHHLIIRQTLQILQFKDKPWLIVIALGRHLLPFCKYAPPP